MRKFTIRVFALLFGTAVFLVACQDTKPSQPKPAQSSPPSVGREYGETLHGALKQANEARATLEASGKALEQAGDTAE